MFSEGCVRLLLYLIILFLRACKVPNTNSEANRTVLSTEIPQQGFHIFYSEVLCVMKELFCPLPYDLLACLSNGDMRQVVMVESSLQRTGLQPLTSPATLPSQQ